MKVEPAPMHPDPGKLDVIVDGITAHIEIHGMTMCKACYEQVLYQLVKELAKRYERLVIEIATESVGPTQ